MRYTARGGARAGAGRPRKHDVGVAHARRPALSGREPVHVTLRVLEHVYHLRARRCLEVVFAAFVAGCRRVDFRVVGLTVQGHHLHLLVEAADARALARGMQGLTIRLAKGLNRVMGRRGKVFRERYHARPLRTPREVRAAMAYIAGNTAKHAAQIGRTLRADRVDGATVGYFGERTLLPPGTAGMVAKPETWLLRHGWRCVGRGETSARDATAAGARAEPRVAPALRSLLGHREPAAAQSPPRGLCRAEAGPRAA